jgi:cell division protein FtsB
MGRVPQRASRAWTAWVWRGLAALALALTFGYLPYHLYGRSGFASYLRLRDELKQLRLQNAHLRAENDRLQRDAQALSTDLRALERVARAELGWVRPGEVIIDVGSETPDVDTHRLTPRTEGRP